MRFYLNSLYGLDYAVTRLGFRNLPSKAQKRVEPAVPKPCNFGQPGSQGNHFGSAACCLNLPDLDLYWPSVDFVKNDEALSLREIRDTVSLWIMGLVRRFQNVCAGLLCSTIYGGIPPDKVAPRQIQELRPQPFIRWGQTTKIVSYRTVSTGLRPLAIKGL